MAYFPGNLFEAEARIERRISHARSVIEAREAAAAAREQERAAAISPDILDLRIRNSIAAIGLLQCGIQIPEPKRFVYDVAEEPQQA